MGGTQRMAAVAAVSHSKLYYNQTAPKVNQNEGPASSMNFYFASGTLCGVMVMVWVVSCLRRKSATVKTEDVDVAECRSVYTVSDDSMLHQEQMDPPGPPPAYETVVKEPTDLVMDYSLEEVVSEPHPLHTPQRRDCELPSYEAAVLLKDTKL